ncbi:MAG: Wzt carbohydrate-binding domain-containing protein, partial [Taibaiella sp.]|nr:Wzt carbohydrate-binding domain-containing protein [Taibaiella sp.]
NLCHKTLVMKHGMVEALEDTPAAIERYLSSGSEVNRYIKWDLDERPGNHIARLNSIKVTDSSGDTDKPLTTADEIKIEISYEVLEYVKNLRVAASLLSFDGEHIFSTSDWKYYNDIRVRERGEYVSTLTIPAKLLNLSTYYVSIDIEIPTEKSIVQAVPVSFNIEELAYNEMGILLSAKPAGHIHPVLDWKVEKLK